MSTAPIAAETAAAGPSLLARLFARQEIALLL